MMPDSAPVLLRKFAAIWLEKRGSRSMPAFADLDPLDMPWALHTIFVLRRRDDGVFAYGLTGEGVATRLGGSLKGKTAFDVFDRDYATMTEARWQKAATERACCYIHSEHRTTSGVPLNAERLLLPLAGEADRVDALIGVSVFRGLGAGQPVDGIHEALLQVVWTPVDEI